MELISHSKDNLGMSQTTYQQPLFTPKLTTAPHDLATMVDYITKVTGVTKEYGYKYWLGKVKRSKKTYTQIVDLVDKAKGLDKKYNKGGYITNNL